MAYDVEHIRRQFPIFERKIGNRPLIYLDNGASSQTPERVVEAVKKMYESHKANVHRGVHTLSQEATDMMEATRRQTRDFINAGSEEEIIFTRGTTEGINLVAASMGQSFKEDDEVILTVMEHHSNIVPWQLLRMRSGIRLRVVGMNDRGELDIEEYRKLFNDRTVMVSFCHVSNVLGTVNPVAEMVEIAHSHGVPVMVDGGQACPHIRIDVRGLDADFYAFSSHKMYGPTGIGVLYGKKRFLEAMPPYQGGGEMIKHVSFDHTTFADLPFKFEAGTPDYVGIAAFSQAMDFMNETGIEAIARHEHELLEHATERLMKMPHARIFGTAPGKTAVLSFMMGETHPYDTGMLLDKLGVAVRTGHHCAQPLMERLGIPGTVRATMAAYNTHEEIDAFADALQTVNEMLGS